MKSLRFLQLATVVEVVLLILAGLYLVLFTPGSMDRFGQLCGAILPFLAPQIAGAFAAKPLANYIDQRVDIARAKNGKG
jgi:hypothetical protein